MLYKNERENTYVAHMPFMNLHTVMALMLNECRYKHLSVKMNEQQILNFTQPYSIPLIHLHNAEINP